MVGLKSILVVLGQSNLQELDLSHNSIDAEGFSIVGQMLSTKSKLKSLVISNNDVGESGAVHLAEGLRKNTALQTLDISHASLTGTGATLIFDALSNHKTLLHLDASNSNIGDEGAIALGNLLRSSNCNIETLVVSMNNIEADGAAALMEALAVNKRLKHFIYGPGNSLIGKAMSSLSRALSLSSSLISRLDVSSCAASSSGLLYLSESLRENTRLLGLSVKGIDLSKIERPFIMDLADNKHLRYAHIAAMQPIKYPVMMTMMMAHARVLS